VGGGVVGLAIAARLAPRFPDLVLVERHPKHGQETSSRNSEVIHAGMYYNPGSLKAVLCVEGCAQLYAIAERHRIPHSRMGKIITASHPDELGYLEKILEMGATNGVVLERLTVEQCRALEPNVRTEGALYSPHSGVISAHDLMDAFAHQARSAGATFLLSATLTGLERRDGDYRVEIRTPDGVESFTSERVINAAGLDADTVAGLAGIDVVAAGYRLHYCKGSYFSVSGTHSKLVSRLIYPVPDKNRVSLGVHALPDLAGRLRFGPDAEYLDDREQDYRVGEEKRTAFAESVRRLVPSIADDDLVPDISGIRPKLQGPGEPWKDFVIRDEADRGLPGLVSLIGIDSPGLTSSPAIADYVARMIR
jgi:L-2-hydroxyglutarate oxidase LhgO